MINRRCGTVRAIKHISGTIAEIKVAIGARVDQAYVFPELCGELTVGDRVILNTTAVDLELGSGGYHFVMAAETEFRKHSDGNGEQGRVTGGSGHIMKLRYTPFQLKACAVEEEDHPCHETFARAGHIKGIPVLGGSLHSALIPAVCGVRAIDSNLRIVYVMTDGGALPLALSHAVRELKEAGFIAGTVTTGHAFGGDLEAVNLYSGLLAAASVLAAEVIVVLMGPGVVGTATKWGQTALEVGQIINAAAALQGCSYTIARLSFTDKRERHYGLSHHTVTALENVALASTNLVLPSLGDEERVIVEKQLPRGLLLKHHLICGDGRAGLEMARRAGFQLVHMGRSCDEDPAYFLAAAAAGEAAAASLGANPACKRPGDSV